MYLLSNKLNEEIITMLIHHDIYEKLKNNYMQKQED